MIEIIRKDKKWIAFNGGGIMEYDDDLGNLFKTLSRRADEIQEDVLKNEFEEENENDYDDDFQPCDKCDLPDSCSDFGCAIKAGLYKPVEF